MPTTTASASSRRRLLALGLGFAVVALLAAAAAARTAPVTAQCPLAPSELTAIVGTSLQRVNLSDPKADPAVQCAFAVVLRGTTSKLGSPQVYYTTSTGSTADLRSLRRYYAQSRAKLATRPRVTLRPEFGPGAFTLAATTGPVTTLFFPVGKGLLGTLSVDLTDGPSAKQTAAIAEKVFQLVAGRVS